MSLPGFDLQTSWAASQSADRYAMLLHFILEVLYFFLNIFFSDKLTQRNGVTKSGNLNFAFLHFYTFLYIFYICCSTLNKHSAI